MGTLTGGHPAEATVETIEAAVVVIIRVVADITEEAAGTSVAVAATMTITDSSTIEIKSILY